MICSNESGLQEEKFNCGSGESFGKVLAVGDVVGVFLDLIDRTISKLVCVGPFPSAF